MTDVVVDRLRIRGGDARRLTTVAARSLPGALDRALADLADVELDRLTVRLADPGDHDDATVAALWADGIRQAALAAGARVRVPRRADAAEPARGSHVPAAPDVASGPASVDAHELAAVVTAWLAAGRGTRVPTAFAALADRDVAVAVLRLLGARVARALVAALERATVRLGTAAAAPVVYPGATRTERSATPGSPAHADHPAAPGTRRLVETPPASAGTTPADRVSRAARSLCSVAETAQAGATSVDLAGVSRAAGLAVTYPWLADLCRLAADLHPGTEPSHPRRVALAALADPEDPDLVDDPLVRFLAGTPRDVAPAAMLGPLDRLDEVRAAADDVLHRFVALLPGFEGSSAGFARAAWLLRTGLLDEDADPAVLVAQTAPLDVVLPLLPYPLGVLRLPWTPVLSVRFRP